jgi:chaperonin cofactor prefoldin
LGFNFLDILDKEHEVVQNRLARMEESLKGTLAGAGDPFELLKLKLVSQMKSEEQHFNNLLFQIKDARNEILASLEDCHFADLVLKELEKLDDTATIKDPESQIFDEWRLDPL